MKNIGGLLYFEGNWTEYDSWTKRYTDIPEEVREYQQRILMNRLRSAFCELQNVEFSKSYMAFSLRERFAEIHIPAAPCVEDWFNPACIASAYLHHSGSVSIEVMALTSLNCMEHFISEIIMWKEFA